MSDEQLHYPFPRSAHGGPPPLYAELRATRPVCPFRAPSGDRIRLVTRYEDALIVLADRRFSRELDYPGAPRLASGEDFNSNPHSLLNMDPPDHSRLRRVLNPAFSARAVERHRPTIQGHVDSLLDRLCEGTGPADYYGTFAIPLATTIMCDFLGIDATDRARIAASLSLQMSVDASNEAKAGAAATIDECATRLVDEKRQRPDEGLISRMLAAEDRLSDAEIVATTSLLLLFGNDTTPPTLSTAIVTLLRHPEQLARLKADPALWPQAVEELVRYRSNGDFAVIRVALEDVELSGVTIRRGEAVMAPVFAASTDPELTERPEEFDLDREKLPPIQYGHGPRFCLGAALVRLILRTALRTTFERFPDLDLAVPLDALEWSDDEFLIHVRELPLTLARDRAPTRA